MSAIRTTCPYCGGQYIAGVVGSTPWPKHECEGAELVPAAEATLRAMADSPRATIDLTEEQRRQLLDQDRLVKSFKRLP